MAGNINQPAFRWPSGSTVNISAGTSSTNVQIQSANLSRHVRLFNAGTATAFIEFGNSSVAATTGSGYPLAAGAIEIVGCGQPYMAGITSSGTTTVYATPGEGQ